MKQHLTLAAVCIAGLLAASMAWADGTVPAMCTPGLQKDEHDPAIRNVVFYVDPNRNDVTVSYCIISNKPGFSELGTRASLFDRSGHLVSPAAWVPLNVANETQNRGPNGPRITLPVSANANRGKLATTDILPYTLIVVQWTCKPDPGCGAEKNATDTYIVPVTFNAPPKPKRH